MSLNIAIINYGMGNLHSVYRKLTQVGVNPVVATTPAQVAAADKIVLPGVGHFEKAMHNLRELGLYDLLNEVVLVKKVPILGICLGMQLMARKSEEGNASGFGWFSGEVQRFRITDTIKHKVPQTGWNTAHICKESPLLQNIADDSEFYFLHSYHYKTADETEVLCRTDFEYEFVSAISKENIFGVQFHPEKSHDTGTRLLKNFIEL